MPARQLGDQFHLVHWRNNAVTIDDEVKFKKNQFSKQTGYTSNISISDDGQKNHDLEFFLDPSHNKPSRAGKDIVTSVFRRCTLDPSPLTRSLILAKTQPSVDLVFKSSLMNWECLCIFQHSMTKYCRRSQRYSKRHKTSFSPLLKRKQSFSDHDDHKIQRWFLFFLFKSKTNKKGEEISNIQPIYEFLQDSPTIWGNLV